MRLLWLPCVLLAACSLPSEPGSEQSSAPMSMAWFRQNVPPSDSPQILTLVNDTGRTATDLVSQCGFSALAAEAIVDYRRGDDPASAEDDRSFTSLVELDRLPFTNEAFWASAMSCARTLPALPACPAPQVFAPAPPAGYLPLVRPTFVYMNDGDSGTFRPSFGAPPVPFRMLFLDTEEVSDGATPLGIATKQRVIDIIRDATDIQITARMGPDGLPELDNFNRQLSLVFVDGDLLQTRLVREGLSVYYTRYGCAPTGVHDALLHAEAEANQARRGVWGTSEHDDYMTNPGRWLGFGQGCRSNPFVSAYCSAP